jgi:hypothetical protein
MGYRIVDLKPSPHLPQHDDPSLRGLPPISHGDTRMARVELGGT